MSNKKKEIIDKIVSEWKMPENQFIVGQFLKRIVDFFQENPRLRKEPLPVVHSVKYRLKNPEHLRDKLDRKWDLENPITVENMFERITDFAGVRVLHLYQQQFPIIHNEIMTQINNKEWYFAEDPVAYTWDPDSNKFFNDLDIKCEIKESQYTSIHYLLKPKEDSNTICEVQVRTLFEEIWGEIDHTLNYPYQTESNACKEQLRVLGKFAATGTRLVDSIFASKKEFDDIHHRQT